MCAKSLQLYPTLCNPMDCSLSGSSVHGIFQVRVLEWVAISVPRGSQPRDRTRNSYVSCIGRRALYHLHYSLSGSSVHGIFQARILEWIATAYFRGCLQSRDQTHISCIGGQIL